MPDDEGFSLPGELQVGGYAAIEGDLGDSLCGPLGFSAPERPLDEFWGVEGGELVFVPAGFATGAYSASDVRFVCPAVGVDRV